MYLIVLLKNGNNYDFHKKCMAYAGSEDKFITFKDKDGGCLVNIPSRSIAAIYRSDQQEFLEAIYPCEEEEADE